MSPTEVISNISAELTPSLIEQLGEAYRQLEAHNSISVDHIQWNEVEEYFRKLDSLLKKKFEELRTKEKELAEKESETSRILAEREAALAAKEQDMLDRIQVLKDAAVAAIIEARSTHMPVPVEPTSSGGDGTKNKVSSSLDVENAPPDAGKEKYPFNLCANLSEVIPRPELVQVCEQMDAKGLVKFTMENLENLSAICKELSVALTSASEPARLVLDSLEGLFPSDEITQAGEDGDAAALKGMRSSCLIFLEALAALLAKADPGMGDLLGPETKQQAKAIAAKWNSNLAGEGTDAANRSSLEVEAFLQLLTTFRIAPEFGEEELCEHLLAVAHQSQAPKLCRSLGLTHKVQDIINTLINRGRQVDAVHFIHAFELSESYPPIPLLRTYLTEARRNSQVGTARDDAGQVDGNALELEATRAVISCIKEYNLESGYPLDPLRRRVGQLVNACTGAKRIGDAGKHPAKKKKANRGFNERRHQGGRGGGRDSRGGSRNRGGSSGGGRQPPPHYDDTSSYTGMPDRYPHASATATYSYPAPGLATAYPPQAADQTSYYYPQDDRAAAPYNTAAPNYGGYVGGVQQSHQEYM